ncbi:MAG TPA: hypothetical protein DDW27_12885 [Bacteroidales bacterium]|nr:hypothetical protein [Bacteroidales bacterium]
MLKYLKVKYAFLFVLLIWLPFQIFVLKADAASRSILMLMFMTVFVNIANFNFMKTIIRAPVIFWGLWVIYAFINTILLGLNTGQAYFTFFVYLAGPLMALWVMSAESFEDRDQLLNIVIAGLYVKLILIFIFEEGRASNLFRLGDKIETNSIAFSALTLIVFIYLKYVFKGIGLKQLLLLVIFPFFIILLTASRNAFGGFVILLLSHFYIHRSKRVLHNIAVIFFGAVFISATFYFIIENTYLGKRLAETTEQAQDDLYYYQVKGTILEKFGDRGYFYILGWDLFKKYPVRGVGVKNFAQFQGRYAMHSEYMVQLCELGIIGTLLFILFYGWLGRNLLITWRSYVDDRKKTEVFIAVYMIILFMALSIFQYNDPVFFLMTGAMTAYIWNKRQQKPETE